MDGVVKKVSGLSQKIFVSFLNLFPENVRSVILTSILSLGAGLSAVAFLFMTNFIFTRTYTVFAQKSPLFFITASFILIMTTSAMVGYLLNVFSPEAAGSGIPQAKMAYWKELGHIPKTPVIVKLIAGTLSIGGGNSLGREGPSVYIGSGVASNLSGLFGTGRRQRRGANLIGASAGLAAAFNTPLAAITFIIEEVVGDINNRYLGRVVLSALIGAFTVHAVLGRHPAFSIPSVENISWVHYAVVPLVALAASFAGVVFHRTTLSWRGILKNQKRIPRWMLPVIGGFITWVIGSGIFAATGKIGIFGLGYQDLSDVLNNQFEWKIAGLLVCGKLIATIAGYSFGGCGGIFAPSLFIGGLTGFFIAGLTGQVIPLGAEDHIVLAAVGMSACMGAIVHAPLTAMLIVFEMTHQFALVPGLMLGTIISLAVSKRFSKLNFYDEILIQDGNELHKIKPPQDLQSWQNLSISVIANPNLVGLRGLNRKEMKEKLSRYPYNVFPVFSRSKVKGFVTREEIQASLESRQLPDLHSPVFCYSDETVREVGDRFVGSTANALVVLDRKTLSVHGILTLHDLLRAQASINL